MERQYIRTIVVKKEDLKHKLTGTPLEQSACAFVILCESCSIYIYVYVCVCVCKTTDFSFDLFTHELFQPSDIRLSVRAIVAAIQGQFILSLELSHFFVCLKMKRVRTELKELSLRWRMYFAASGKDAEFRRQFVGLRLRSLLVIATILDSN
ncbi:hypothetical protein RFI_02265 [Reticulomyxa filosa]|uniref:Uncharacterized protein n=1 Tax=Reticulomyxa filosa TaxID=46433 RepID=X6P9I0_RETFI|nr:hypothetical protein RFI_02265 [Reticulomyxa filosa]|eukprot:ETO34826.1 hypothetical protein RFI_02265 [Reticulomyxa filosa]